MTTKLDKDIQALFTKLNERKGKLAELKDQSSSGWKTNASFRLLGSTSITNIQTASPQMLHEIASHLELLSLAQERANAQLGLSETKLQGYTVDAWYSDIRKRLAVITLRSEEAAIADLETRLNQVLSPEEQRRMQVALLAKELG